MSLELCLYDVGLYLFATSDRYLFIASQYLAPCMRHIAFVIGLLLIGFAAYTSYSIRQQQLGVSELREDYAEINRINYGLFNIQLWKDKTLDVMTSRISSFTISDEAFGQAKDEIESYLFRMYDRYIERGELFEQIFDEVEREGKVNKMFITLLRDNLGPQIKKFNLKRQIPGLAAELATELRKQEPQFQAIMQAELAALLRDTDPATYQDRRIPIYSKYDASSLKDATANIVSRMEREQALLDQNVRSAYQILLGLVVLITLLYLVLGHRYYLTLLTILSIVFLALGISLPMIDIDARLNQFGINVLGSDISFDEQVLYYQSKSILDVTWTLLEGRGIDLKIVGLLILLFSIVVPLLKLLFSMMYLYVERVRTSKIIRGIIFYLGKWSMADVFVVAMFMAYIGFQGLVTSQLGEIGRNNSGFAVETLNYSKLAPGALFFTTYCILSIIIGTAMAAKHRREHMSD